MPWTRDPQTGELVYTPEEQPRPISVPGTQQPVPLTGSAPTPTPASQPPTRPMFPSTAEAGNPTLFGQQLARRNSDGSLAFPWEPEPLPEGGGGVIGRDVGRYNGPPELDLGSGLLEEDQALIEALQGIQTSLGSVGQPGPAPQLPQAPAVTADPGLGMMSEHAQNRMRQIEPILSELRADAENRRTTANNKWTILGQWLSGWAASGDAASAGVVMSQVLANNREMQADIRREMLQLTQMGWSAEDAAMQAQANLLSGRHAAEQQTADRRYQRDTAQTGLESDYQLAGIAASSRSASAQANLAARIAEITHEASQRARDERRGAALALTDVPQYSSSAWGEVIPENLQGSEAGSALAGSLAERQAEMGLMAYIAANQGSRDRSVLQFLRQWDPRLTAQDIQRSTPQALLMRLSQAPNARQAYQRNAQALARASRFMAPTE